MAITISNSDEIKNEVTNKLVAAITEIWKKIATVPNFKRSSRKTDILHECIREVLIDSLGSYMDQFNKLFELIAETANSDNGKTAKIDSVRDIFGQKFNVDMMLKRMDIPHTGYLAKCALNTINKNRYNYGSGQIGEIFRFFGGDANINMDLVFFNITPKITFNKSKGTSTLKKEIVKYLGLTTVSKDGRVLDKLKISDDIKNKIHEIHIEYEINFGKDFSEIKTEEELNQLISDNKMSITIQSDQLKHLISYTEYFIAKNLA